MPLVHIDMTAGRTPEQLANMYAAVAKAISETVNTSIESVRIVVNEMEPYQYSVGGKPWPQVFEERQKAKQAQER